MAEFKIRDRETGEIFTIREKFVEQKNQTKRPSYYETAIKPFGKTALLLAKGIYFGVPKKIRSAGGLLEEGERSLTEKFSKIKAEGTGEKVTEAIGGFIPFSKFVKPFSYATRALPFIRQTPAIIKSLATGAGYGASRAVLEGTPEEALPEAARTMGQFGMFHLGGKAGATLGKIIPEKLQSEATRRLTSAFGGGLAGTMTSPEEPEIGAVFGAGLGALYPARPFGKNIENLDRFIDTSIEKAIRPTVIGKKTYRDIQSYRIKAREAIKTIYQNRDNLGLTDEVGEPVKRLPQSLKDLSQGIENTKTYIFKVYDALAKQAGEKGWNYNPDTVTAKLYEVSKDLKFSPQIRKYAESLIPEVEELRGANPEILQERIRELNSSLESYYNNRVDKAKARVDASVANLLRRELDQGVSDLTGARYQVFKDKYGALKTIEKDLNRRLIVDARKNLKGFFDITDIFSGGQIVSGVFTLDPARVAAGITSKGILTWYKYINDPNRIIRNMFTTINQVSKGNVESKILTRFNRFRPSEKILNEMRQEGMEKYLKKEGKGELSLRQAINQFGGIAPYTKKYLPGALREEYQENVPLYLRNKQGLKLDEMAAVLKENYPQFGIENETDLLNALVKEKQVEKTSFGKFRKSK